jgi:hypothetical protein
MLPRDRLRIRGVHKFNPRHLNPYPGGEHDSNKAGFGHARGTVNKKRLYFSANTGFKMLTNGLYMPSVYKWLITLYLRPGELYKGMKRLFRVY